MSDDLGCWLMAILVGLAAWKVCDGIAWMVEHIRIVP